MAKENKIKRGVIAVIFRLKGKIPEFLILHRVKGWTGWELLKGGRKGNEKPINNLMRELKEEINVDEKQIGLIIKLPFKLKIKSKEYIFKEFDSFIVEYYGQVSIKENKSMEHDDYRWVKLKEGIKLVSYSSNKSQLRKAYSFLKKNSII